MPNDETRAVLDALRPLLDRSRVERGDVPAPPRPPGRVLIPTPTMMAAPAPPPAVPLPRIILPDGTTPTEAQAIHPHRRTERMIYAGAALAFVAGIGTLLLAEPRTAKGDSTTGLAASRPAGGTARATPAAGVVLEIGGGLPDDARITANGRELATRATALVAGIYVLTASAPGHVTVMDTLAIEGGRAVVWTPKLVPVPEPAQPRRARRSASAEELVAERRRRALEAAIAREGEAIRRAEQRLQELSEQ